MIARKVFPRFVAWKRRQNIHFPGPNCKLRKLWCMYVKYIYINILPHIHYNNYITSCKYLYFRVFYLDFGYFCVMELVRLTIWSIRPLFYPSTLPLLSFLFVRRITILLLSFLKFFLCLFSSKGNARLRSACTVL